MSKRAFSSVPNEIKKLGGSSFLTEFGYSINNQDDKNYVNSVLDLTDENYQSWTEWGYTGGEWYFPNNGTIKPNYSSVFSRTYARAISGIPTKMNFNVDTKFFILCYQSNADIKANTEIFVPYKFQYEPLFAGVYVEGNARIEKVRSIRNVSFVIEIKGNDNGEVCVMVKKYNSCQSNKDTVACIKY